MIDALPERPEATRALADLDMDRVAVSPASYGGLYEGAYDARESGEALAGLQQFMDGVMILPLTPAIMERFAVVRGGRPRRLRRRIGDMDHLIAATAPTHDLALLTRNLRDFRHVPDLKLYEETADSPVGDSQAG